jgi:hypothetical protein
MAWQQFLRRRYGQQPLPIAKAQKRQETTLSHNWSQNRKPAFFGGKIETSQR